MKAKAVVFILMAGSWASSAHAQAVSTGTLSLDSLLSIPISAASRHEQNAREAPASITVLTREDLERGGFLTIAEALATVQGFYMSHDRNFEALGTRGFGRPSDYNNRILLLQDGVRRNDIHNGEAPIGSAYLFSLDVVDRIEIVRGPGSALYGSSAMLAVVNVITRAGASVSGGEVEAELASFGYRRASVVMGRKLADDVDLLVHGVWQDTEGADLYFPEFDDADSDGWARGRNWDRIGGGMARVTWGDLAISARAGYQKRADPTAPFQSSFDSETSWRSKGLAGIDATWSRALSPKTGLTVSGYGWGTQLGSEYYFDDPLPDLDVDVFGTVMGLDTQLRFDPVPQDRLVFGAEVRRSTSDILFGKQGADYFDGGEPESLLSAYVQNEWQATRFASLVVGGRLDQYSIAGSALSPRGALVIHPGSKSTLKVMYGEAFRAPTPLEQFPEEPGIWVANPDLGPERVRSVELVVDQRFAPGLHVTASVFRNSIRDLIAQNLDPDLGVLIFRNRSRAQARGVGIGLFGRAAGSIAYSASWNYQQSEDLDSGLRLVNSPEHQARASVTTEIPGGLHVNVRGSYDSARRTYLGADTDGFALVSTTLSGLRFGAFSAKVGVLNALDSPYTTPAGAEHRLVGIPQDGRTLRVSVKATF